MSRMTVTDLIDRVLTKVDDDESFSRADALQAINECNVNIATEIDVKELATVSEITCAADSNSVALPSDFLRNLTYAYNKTTDLPVTVYDSRRLVDKKYRGNTGSNVIYLCNDFPNAYYRHAPSAEQLIDLYYHALPDTLEEGDDFPGYIPSNYIYNIYFNYACSQLYDFLEDGMEGEKVNTLYHMDRANKELEKLKMFIGPDPDEAFNPDYYNRNFDFSDY